MPLPWRFLSQLCRGAAHARTFRSFAGDSSFEKGIWDEEEGMNAQDERERRLPKSGRSGAAANCTFCDDGKAGIKPRGGHRLSHVRLEPSFSVALQAVSSPLEPTEALHTVPSCTAHSRIRLSRLSQPSCALHSVKRRSTIKAMFPAPPPSNFSSALSKRLSSPSHCPTHSSVTAGPCGARNVTASLLSLCPNAVMGPDPRYSKGPRCPTTLLVFPHHYLL